MWWVSIYGSGLTIHGVERTPDDRVEFTVWLSIFYIPLIPITSWSGLYDGEIPTDGITDGGPKFVNLVRRPHDWVAIVQTFARGMLMLAIAIAPAAYMMWRVRGRGANNVEMVFVFASAAWPVLLIIATDRYRKNKALGK